MGATFVQSRQTTRACDAPHDPTNPIRMSLSSHRLVAYACLASSMALTGTYVALSKPLVAVLPVFLLAWLRFGIAALAMSPWLRSPAHEPPLTPQVRWLVFMESPFGNFLLSICMLYGVSMTSAVSAGVILASIPAVIGLMSWAFLRDRNGPRIWSATGRAATLWTARRHRRKHQRRA